MLLCVFGIGVLDSVGSHFMRMNTFLMAQLYRCYVLINTLSFFLRSRVAELHLLWNMNLKFPLQ
jgi:hypothetical protein